MKTTITHFAKKLFVLFFLLLSAQTAMSQFTPGEGGSIPAFTPFTVPPGKIGGFHITTSARENNSFYTGTRAVVDMYFPAPSQYGANSYTLQYSSNDGAIWNNYQYNSTDLVTSTASQDNFSLNLNGSYKLRLLVNGGSKNGFTSNELYAPLSSVDTYFGSWGLDESMYLSGVMSPWVGRGLAASVVVKKNLDNSVVSGGLTYQWYRVNPASYEMTAVLDSTKLTYTTTQADLGYLLAMRAKGDELSVGGFIQIMSGTSTVMANKAFVSNVSNSGFRLNFYKTVSGLAVSDLILYDKTYNPVAISAVTKNTNFAIYDISAVLDTAKCPYFVENVSSFWRLAYEFKTPMFTDLMQGISFSYTINTKIDEIKDGLLSVYPVPAKDRVSFNAKDNINQAIICTVKGEELIQTTFNNKEGTINTSGLNNGIYILRLITSSTVYNRKIQILK